MGDLAHVDFLGESGFRDTWRKITDVFGDGVHRAVMYGVYEGAAEARARHGYTSRTGNLEKHTIGRVIGFDRTSADGEIAAEEPYASFVDEGTAAHEIRPKADYRTIGPMNAGQSRRARGTGGARAFLAWQPTQGDWHFARVVHHPGTKPYHFMALAYDKCSRVMVRELEMANARSQALIDR